MPADRAYLPGGRVGAPRAALEALTARMLAGFEAAGAVRVDPAALHPADALLDVYGEDLRGRAFLVAQPGGPDLFMRPDFTLPVLQLHLAARAEPARYAYLGPVWRRQPAGSGRPVEFLQAGVEIFGEDAAQADADAFALARAALAAGGVDRPNLVTGDLGVILAMLDAAPLTARRRAALKRHFWRPRRFHDLLRRFVAAPAPAAAHAATDALALGARSREEVAAGLAALAEDAAAPALPAAAAQALEAAVAVEGPAPAARDRLAALAAGAGLDVAAALARLDARLAALAARGVDVAALPFRAGLGRTLEYYDGFVFEMAAPGRADLPPLAAGGRYDGVAAALGAPPAPAVGASVRPEAVMAAGGAAC